MHKVLAGVLCAGLVAACAWSPDPDHVRAADYRTCRDAATATVDGPLQGEREWAGAPQLPLSDREAVDRDRDLQSAYIDCVRDAQIDRAMAGRDDER